MVELEEIYHPHNDAVVQVVVVQFLDLDLIPQEMEIFPLFLQLKEQMVVQVIVEVIIDQVEEAEQQLLEQPHLMDHQVVVVEQGQLQVFHQVQHLFLEAAVVVSIMVFQVVEQLVLVELVKLLVQFKEQDLQQVLTLVVVEAEVQVVQVQDKMVEMVALA